jgi:uncharacterized protein (TIGR02246 family)
VTGLLGIIVLSGAGWRAFVAPASDEAAVRALVVRMSDAWNAGSPAGVAAEFTNAGVMIAGEGTLSETRDGIERYLAHLRATMPPGTRFALKITSVRFIHRDVAIVMSEGGFLPPPDTAVTAARFGVQSVVAVRSGADWQASLFQRTRIVR